MTDARSAAGVGSHPAPAGVSGDSDGNASAVPPDQDARMRAPRLAVPEDAPEIVRLIRELADYERALHEVRATPDAIAELLFSAGTGPLPGPVAACHVVDADPDDPDAPAGLAGMALWFRNASTWLAVPGIYLEDLYVSPAYRGRGYGRALLATLAAVCVEHGYGRLDWAVLDWNSPAWGFYASLGAEPMKEWTGHRLAGDALRALAAEVNGSVSRP